MGSRERKRAARQKRKTKSAERRSAEELAADATTAGSANGDGAGAEVMARAESASERKNREAREALEPLAEGERPTVVTIGAAISVLVAISGVVAYAAGVEINGERPPVTAVLGPALLLGIMAYGLWRARYWAVLGFQALLVILIVSASLGLLQATKVAQVIGNVALLAVTGALFYFMVKAWARIQMPERPGRD